MFRRCLCSLLLVGAIGVVGCSDATTTKPNTAPPTPGPAANKGAERTAPVEKVPNLPPK